MATVQITGKCPACGQEFKKELELAEEKAARADQVVFKSLPLESTFVVCENPQCEKPFMVKLPKRS